MEHFVEFENVSKYYQTGSVRIAAADHLNFYVDKGEFCIIVGPSGAGKTTGTMWASCSSSITSCRT